MVLLQNPNIPVLFDQPLGLQVGRTFIHLAMKKAFKLFSCICSSIKNEKNLDYQILNSKHINFEKINNVKNLNDYTLEDENVQSDDDNLIIDIKSIRVDLERRPSNIDIKTDKVSLRAVNTY